MVKPQQTNPSHESVVCSLEFKKTRLGSEAIACGSLFWTSPSSHKEKNTIRSQSQSIQTKPKLFSVLSLKTSILGYELNKNLWIRLSGSNSQIYSVNQPALRMMTYPNEDSVDMWLLHPNSRQDCFHISWQLKLQHLTPVTAKTYEQIKVCN